MCTELALKLVSDHDLTVWNRTAVASLQEQQKKGHGMRTSPQWWCTANFGVRLGKRDAE